MIKALNQILLLTYLLTYLFDPLISIA